MHHYACEAKDHRKVQWERCREGVLWLLLRWLCCSRVNALRGPGLRCTSLWVVTPSLNLVKGQLKCCSHVRWLVCVLLVRDCQTQLDQGQVRLVMGGKGPAPLDKENTSWQMSVLSVFFFHEALCCGLFRSPCHGKCSRNDRTTQTARLEEAAIQNFSRSEQRDTIALSVNKNVV